MERRCSLSLGRTDNSVVMRASQILTELFDPYPVRHPPLRAPAQPRLPTFAVLPAAAAAAAARRPRSSGKPPRQDASGGAQKRGVEWFLELSSSRRLDSARWAYIAGGLALMSVSGAVCRRSLVGSRRRRSPACPRSVASPPRVRGVLAKGVASTRLEERGRADVFTSVSMHIVCGEAGDARSGCACVLEIRTLLARL